MHGEMVGVCQTVDSKSVQKPNLQAVHMGQFSARGHLELCKY